MKNMITTVRIETKTTLRVLFTAAAFVGAIYLAVILKTELVWLGAAIFLALALNPAVEFFAGFLRGSRALATTAVFLVFVTILGFIGYSLVPQLVKQATDLATNLPDYAQRAAHSQGLVGQLIRQNDIVKHLHEIEKAALNQVSNSHVSVFKIFERLFSGIAAVVTILVLTFFILLEGPAHIKRFWALQQPARRKRNQALAHAMYHAVTGYVTGNLITSVVAAVLSMTALLLLRVPDAIALGLVVGLLDLIPLIGATLAAVIVVLVAVLTSPGAGLTMLIFFAIYQQVENHVLQPIIYGRTVKLSPLVVLIAIICGAALAGIFGAFVAIPLAASIKILIEHHKPQTQI